MMTKTVDLIIGRLHGQDHVRARIAIRDRENVQGVDRLLVGSQPGQPGFDQFFERLPVDGSCFKALQPSLNIRILAGKDSSR